MFVTYKRKMKNMQSMNWERWGGDLLPGNFVARLGHARRTGFYTLAFPGDCNYEDEMMMK